MIEEKGANFSTLKYENQLLKERNRVLTCENETLLLKVEEFSFSLKKAEEDLERINKQYNLLLKNQNSQKQAFSLLIQSLKKGQRSTNNEKFNIVQQMTKNKVPTDVIIKTISQLIHENQDKQNRSNNINKLGQMVQKRRQKLQQKYSKQKQILHIVKQVNYKQSSNTDSDLQFVVRTSEKLANKIKRTEFSTQSINAFFNQILSYIKLRKSIRFEQKSLNSRQRQLQLGVGCRIAFEESSLRLMQLNAEELKKKQQLNIKITKF